MSSPAIWFGNAVKFLKSKLFFFNGISIETGNVNPTVTPTSGEPGSQYNSSLTSAIYVKQDSGSSTNWSLLDDSSNEIPAGGTTGQVLSKDSNSDYDVEWSTITSGIGITLTGIGGAIETGGVWTVTVPFNCTITSWTLTNPGVAGDIIIDVKKSTYANFPTTASIAGSELPTLSDPAVKAEDTNLTTWTTAVTAGDIIEFEVMSATDIEVVNLHLGVSRT